MVMRKIIYHNKHHILKLYYQGVPPAFLMREYRIPSSTLYSWIAKNPRSVVMTTTNSQEITNWYHRERRYKKTEKKFEFIYRAVIKNMPRSEKIAIIDREYGKESLHVQCEALNLNRSTYINHRYRSKKENAWFKKREAEYSEIIRKIYEKSGHVYGGRKIAAIMRKDGYRVSDKYVRRRMSEMGIRSNRSASDKDHLLVARHLREARRSALEFKPDSVNQVWVSDTSAVLTHGRLYYICVYLDLFSRKAVAWRIGRNNSTQLVKRTFLEGYSMRSRPKSLVIHTDNGACYTAYSYEQILRKYRVSHSLSRAHVPHDNAVAESFFNTLKREGIFLNGYPRSLRELNERVSMYIEYYNSTRPHEHLGYLSPNEFERQKHL